MEKDARIYVAGHQGLVGSALVRELKARGHTRIIVRTRQELDLMDRAATEEFFRAEHPEYVYVAAARVGGIWANANLPADFIRDNLLVQLNVIEASRLVNVTKLLFLGSSCIYPKLAPQPMKEEHLLSGPLEPTNEPYAIAKIAGIKLCQAYNRQHGTNYVSVMPTNLYGPGDNFDLQTSHVLPALMRKFHEAKESHAANVTVWGTGTPRREFLHVDDMARACLHVMDRHDGSEIVNIGAGEDVSIRELAELVGEVVGFSGEIIFDSTKPDGTPRKLLDISRIRALGWSPEVSLREGVESTYEWYLEHVVAGDRQGDGDAGVGQPRGMGARALAG